MGKASWDDGSHDVGALTGQTELVMLNPIGQGRAGRLSSRGRMVKAALMVFI